MSWSILVGTDPSCDLGLYYPTHIWVTRARGEKQSERRQEIEPAIISVLIYIPGYDWTKWNTIGLKAANARKPPIMFDEERMESVINHTPLLR